MRNLKLSIGIVSLLFVLYPNLSKGQVVFSKDKKTVTMPMFDYSAMYMTIVDCDSTVNSKNEIIEKLDSINYILTKRIELKDTLIKNSEDLIFVMNKNFTDLVKSNKRPFILFDKRFWSGVGTGLVIGTVGYIIITKD